MTPPRKPPPAPDIVPPPTDGKPGQPGAKAFDIWLERGLHDLYDQFAQEPIPEAIKRIIEADKAKKS